jgi:KRAB domain-containing zinc finger protein
MVQSGEVTIDESVFKQTPVIVLPSKFLYRKEQKSTETSTKLSSLVVLQAPAKTSKEFTDTYSGDWQCYICGELKAKRLDTLGHIRANHYEKVRQSMYGPPREFQCQQCKIMFQTNGALGLHLCGQVPPSWDGKFKQPNQCGDCGKTFRKRYDMLSHITKAHTKTKNFACEHCDYKASVPFLLTKHVRRMHSERVKSHLCTQCGSMFSERTHLMSHVKYVHKVTKENSICYSCGMVIRTEAGMLKHIMEIHGKQVNRTMNEDPTKPFKCETCSQEFSEFEVLRKHLRDEHKSERDKSLINGVEGKPKIKYRYACPHCGKLVSNKYSLEHHINKIHELGKRYPCSYCPKAFFDSQSLKKHELKHTGICRLHDCHVCGKEFSSKSLCLRHVKSVHEKTEVYVCDTCGFRSFHAYSLTAHIQQVHEKYKPNKCEYCEEGFFYKRDLEKHYTKAHQVVTSIAYAVIDDVTSQ